MCIRYGLLLLPIYFFTTTFAAVRGGSSRFSVRYTVYVTDRTNHNQDLFFMRRISNYRKLLGVGETAELKELKTVYRNLMKDWHPDKFQDTPEARLEAEEKSKKIIEAYHFLVSIAPETRAGTLAAYTTTTTEAGIIDFEYKSELLSISFSDGSVYEYYGVPKAIYVKLINAETPARFARRHIYHVYIYRSTTRQVAVV